MARIRKKPLPPREHVCVEVDAENKMYEWFELVPVSLGRFQQTKPEGREWTDEKGRVYKSYNDVLHQLIEDRRAGMLNRRAGDRAK